jgi:hypothetical protein
MGVIVTADDYGLSVAINEAVERLAEQGAIDAVSVMVHADSQHETLRRLKTTGVRTGLHLTLTGQRPVSPAVGRSDLVDREGRLPATWRALMHALLRHPRRLGLLEVEIAAQIDRFAATGLALDFLNGHEHVHAMPLLWPRVVAAAAPRTGAFRLAVGQRIGLTRQGMVSMSSRFCWSLRALPHHVILSPFGLNSSQRMDLSAIRAALSERLAPVAAGIVQKEIIVHPAVTPVVAGVRGENRRREFDILLSCEYRDLRRDPSRGNEERPVWLTPAPVAHG